MHEIKKVELDISCYKDLQWLHNSTKAYRISQELHLKYDFGLWVPVMMCAIQLTRRRKPISFLTEVQSKSTFTETFFYLVLSPLL